MPINIPTPGETGGGSATDQDLRDWVAAGFGWASYSDTTYTSGSPQSVTASTRTVLLNDGGSVVSDLPVGTTSLWSGNKITPDTSSDDYDVRIQFGVTPASPNGYFDLILSIAATPTSDTSLDISTRTIGLQKGTAPTTVQVAFPIFTLGTFLANGGSIILNSNVNLSIYDCNVFIKKTYNGQARPT